VHPGHVGHEQRDRDHPKHHGRNDEALIVGRSSPEVSPDGQGWIATRSGLQVRQRCTRPCNEDGGKHHPYRCYRAHVARKAKGSDDHDQAHCMGDRPCVLSDPLTGCSPHGPLCYPTGARSAAWRPKAASPALGDRLECLSPPQCVQSCAQGEASLAQLWRRRQIRVIGSSTAGSMVECRTQAGHQ